MLETFLALSLWGFLLIRILDVAVVKNGAVINGIYGRMPTRAATQSVPYNITTPFYAPDMKSGDYLEVWVTSSSNGDVVKTEEVSWWLDSH